MSDRIIYTALSYARDAGVISQADVDDAVRELQRKDTALALMSRVVARRVAEASKPEHPPERG
ncbi:hypothetical protein GHK68_24390 [Sinorhizobium meliloti]|uniref:hypothetical protein n=1 Tax=Rhizobium meliloti TaxID=382 RepID=UPI001296FF05|nr:hypothetical protein [Sinorhizobium meliloti]MQW45313.1 hypothetical protein [Sinorhizobium meliloti]